MAEQQDFLRFVEQCHRPAEAGDVAGHRDALERMAHEWRRLASEEERIADLVRAVDNLFSAPGDSLNAGFVGRGRCHRVFWQHYGQHTLAFIRLAAIRLWLRMNACAP